ncbi:MAG: BBE domain-containing protein [Actinomycetota bacterium]
MLALGRGGIDGGPPFLRHVRALHERLVQLKREWDPDNLFRLNQNIEP